MPIVFKNDKLRKVRGIFKPALNRALLQMGEEAMEQVKEDARALAPVDTGSLQQSIRRETRLVKEGLVQMAVVAGGNVTNPKTGWKVDYAAYVEYGTSRMAAMPFMTPAFRANEEKFVKLMVDAARMAWEDVIQE